MRHQSHEVKCSASPQSPTLPPCGFLHYKGIEMPYKDPEQQRAYQKAYRKSHKEEAAAYRESHKEKAAAYAIAYHVAYPGKFNAYMRAQRAARSDEFRARDRAYYRAHRDKKLARAHIYNETHRERGRATTRAWQKANPEKIAAHNLHRRARLAGADGHGYTAAEHIKARWAMWGNRCYICGAPAEATDHVIPLARGGSHWPANLRPICKSCNSRKGARLLHKKRPLTLARSAL